MIEFETYDELSIDDNLKTILKNSGYSELTTTQAELVDTLLNGRDLIAPAEGDHDIIACTVAMIEQIDPDEEKLQALVLCPTNDETNRVASIINVIAKKMEVSTASILEGESLDKDAQLLKKNPTIVIATLEKIADHLDKQNIDLQYLRILIIDRADGMIDLGLTPIIEDILEELKIHDIAQTVILSTSLPEEIKQISWKYLIRPKYLFEQKTRKRDSYHHEYYPVMDTTRFNTLCAWLDMEMKEENMQSAVVFTRSNAQSNDVAYSLNMNGFEAEVVVDKLTRFQKTKLENSFKEPGATIVVTTDMFFSTLPLNGVTHIVNFYIPNQAEDLAQRISTIKNLNYRGTMVSLITSHEHKILMKFEKQTRETVVYGEYDLADLLSEYHFTRDHSSRENNNRSRERQPDRQSYNNSRQNESSNFSGPNNQNSYKDNKNTRQRGSDRDNSRNNRDYQSDNDDYMRFKTLHGGRKFTYRYRFVK